MSETPRIVVRAYQPEDAADLAAIFYYTVHCVCIQDYTQKQVDAIAPPSKLGKELWEAKFSHTKPFVAVVGAQTVGFAEFEPSGYIDCFYVHHEWIEKGVGSALMQAVIERAEQMGIARIYTEASITARPFFERKGFVVTEHVTKVRRGVELLNFKMERSFSAEPLNSEVEGARGLPLEYCELAPLYDLLTQSDDVAKNKTVYQILQPHRIRTLLDFSCGTGAQSLYLAERGYQVTAVDISRSLLEIARKKAADRKLSISFLEGDMRASVVGEFDAIITIFNAIGHLTRADFERALQNIAANLVTGGLYLFDILNLEALSDEIVEGYAHETTKYQAATSIHYAQRSELLKGRGLLTSHDTFVIQEGSKAPRTLKNSFSLQLYTADAIRELLERCGFATLGQYAIDGSPLIERESENIFTLSKKL